MSFYEQLAQFIEAKREPTPRLGDNLQNEREALTVEESAQALFSFEEFSQLQLPLSSYPHIVKKFPRWYLKEDSSVSLLKNEFQDLSLLKRRLLDKAIWSLYGSREVTGKIVLVSWVVPGGFGDYYAAIESIRTLHKQMPNVEIHLVAVLGIGETFSSAFDAGISMHQVFYESETTCPSHIIWPQEVVELFATADFILQIPVYFPPLFAALDMALPMRPSCAVDLVREYGFIASRWLSPPPLAKSMGIHPLEMGIFIKELSFSKKAFTSLMDRLQIACGEKESRAFFGYLVTEEGCIAFLYALLTYMSEDTKDIDLYVHQMAVYLMQWEKMREDLEMFGISELIFHSLSKSLTVPLRGKKRRKRLRIIHTGAMSHEEFQSLLLYSEDFVACRGNQSFSEIVSAGKIFFYDGLLHTADFLKDLVALCNACLPEYPKTGEYLRLFLSNMAHFWKEDRREWVEEEYFEYPNDLTPKQVGKRMGTLLKDPETKMGIHKLNLLLKERHNVACHLTAMVKRALVVQRYPLLAQREEKLILDFIEEKKSFSSMIVELRHLLEYYPEF